MVGGNCCSWDVERCSICRRIKVLIITMIIIIVIITTTIIIMIIADIYKAPFLSRAHSALQIYRTSIIHNAQETIASNHV